MVSPTDIIADIASKGAGKYNITWKVFSEVEEVLSDKRAKYSYNSATGILRFLMPTFIHASCNGWISRWVQGMETSGDIARLGARAIVEATLQTFQKAYDGSKKTPDAGIYPRGRKWPSIALEAGYSESSEELIEDTKLLLEGSEGRIGLVIIVKVEPLKPNEREIQNGFIQVYKYDQEMKRIVSHGGRIRLYPPPASRLQQCLKFTWNQVLRNKLNEHISDSEQPPPLYLEDLRTILNEDVARHLEFQHLDGEEDSEKE